MITATYGSENSLLIDGETILDENDDELVGKESLIHWMCPKSGCDALG